MAKVEQGKDLHISFNHFFFLSANPLLLNWQPQHQTLHLQFHSGVQPRLAGISQFHFLIPVGENLIATT